jgi:PPP family 3-phenylpropionic acid transporter
MKRADKVPVVKPDTAVIGVFLLFGVMIAAFFPFFALFLNDKGLSDGRIGLALAAMALARVLTAPAWGHLADTRFGRLRVMQIGLIATSALALALFMADGFAAITVVAFVLAAATTATGPNIDAIALAHLGDARMGEYSKIRSLESLSYAVACLVYGLILEASGVRWSMVIFSITGLLLLAWSRVLRPDAPKGSAHTGRLGTVGAVFRAAPRFPLYLLAMLLVWSGFNAAWNFFSLRIEAAGGGPLLVGIGTALGGAIEVPVMLMAGRLHRTLGLRKTWVFGALVYAFAFVLWGLVNDPRIISTLTVFEGIGFAFLFTSGVVIVGKLVPKELYSTGQSLAGMVGFGLAPIVGAGFGGIVLERFGPIWLYSIASMLALCGAAVGWIALRGRDLTEGLEGVEVIVEPSP